MADITPRWKELSAVKQQQFNALINCACSHDSESSFQLMKALEKARRDWQENFFFRFKD
jgi:hypothetical protein